MASPRSISQNGATAFASVQCDGSTADLGREAVDGLIETAGPAEPEGVQVEYGGELPTVLKERSTGPAEMIGIIDDRATGRGHQRSGAPAPCHDAARGHRRNRRDRAGGWSDGGVHRSVRQDRVPPGVVHRCGGLASFVPMMLFAILFGLSMDYKVFILFLGFVASDDPVVKPGFPDGVRGVSSCRCQRRRPTRQPIPARPDRGLRSHRRCGDQCDPVLPGWCRSRNPGADLSRCPLSARVSWT